MGPLGYLKRGPGPFKKEMVQDLFRLVGGRCCSENVGASDTRVCVKAGGGGGEVLGCENGKGGTSTWVCVGLWV